MSVGSIQAFLNSKVPNCDTWGSKQSELGGGTRAQWLSSHGYSLPVTCLKDFYENPANGQTNYGQSSVPAGGISAAQIIYNYSQQFGINPQVILVTLQKEMGLVTDEWPTLKQYREAMGFGCPDNVAPGAPACDPSFGSFAAQVYQAARHFRGYIDRPAGWWIPFNTGVHSIAYNPEAHCGNSSVNIENRATAALYSYTPYQPNQAALDAGWGTAHCGAYGNRNFYLYFTSWFGSTRDVFTPLQMQRWMRVKQDTYKRAIGTGQTVDQLLPAGTQILMMTKIDFNGVTYLRTAHDTAGQASKGIRSSDMEEIPYEAISNPRWMSLKKNAYKQIPRNGQNVDGLLSRDRFIYFDSKTTINGEIYVRTQHDTSLGNDKAIPYSFLDDTVAFDPMGSPRWMELSQNTQKLNVFTNSPVGSSLSAGTHLSMKDKILVGETWYLRTAEDAQQGLSVGIPAGKFKELKYTNLLYPRTMKLKIATKKIDPLNDLVYNPQYAAGLEIPFASKIFVNGEWYLRSAVDTKSNVSLAIPMSQLEEL